MKTLSIERMERIEGGCDVIYTFNGSLQDFANVVSQLMDMGYTGQANHIANLYNAGCVQVLQ